MKANSRRTIQDSQSDYEISYGEIPMKLFIEEQAGKIQVSVLRTAALTSEPYGESVDFSFPIKPEELEDLRWYLEDYLPAPYAVWEEKGVKVHEKLKEWGTRLFQTIFVNQQSFRDAYVECKVQDDFQIWISSYSAEFLGRERAHRHSSVARRPKTSSAS